MGLPNPSLDISPNETTRVSKNYLYSFGKKRTSTEDLINGLKKISKDNPVHKYLVNVELFMHITDPTVEEIYENDEIPFEFIPYNYPGISPEFYCTLVIQLDLHNQFLQMISVTKNKEFFQGLIATVVCQLFSNNNQMSETEEEVYAGAPIELWRLYLINVAKFSKDDDKNINIIYTDLFKQLLDAYLASNIPKQEKLSMLLRIAGIVCMKTVDYEGDSEIAELNRDWGYDPTANLAKKTRETFKVLYVNLDSVPSEESCSKSVLNLIIDLLTNSEDLQLNDTDKSEWTSLYRTRHLTWLSYIGACSYLTHMIVTKYNDEIGVSASALLSVIANFVRFKPKMAEEDFHCDIENFDQFCELLSIYGNRERYQRKWFQEFLNFPEALTASNGVLLAVKFVAAFADFDIALGLVNKALELDISINERIKCMVISMLSANNNVRHRKQEFVTEVFKNGVHSLFVKEEFIMDFNMLCTKLGSIENESDPKLQSYWENIVYSICFQNPVIAAEGILKQSIRINQFKALRIAKPFLEFETDEVLSEKLANIPIFQSSLFNIIHATEDYDPLFDHLIQAVPAFMQYDFIDFWTFHEFLIHIMGDVILKRKMNKVFKLVLMYEMLLQYDVKKLSEDSSRFNNFLDSLRVFTYAQAKYGALSVMIKIRDKVYELKSFVAENSPKNSNLSKQVELTPELEAEYGMLSLVELGALYTRNSRFRDSVVKFFQDTDNFTRVSFSLLLKTVVSLVFNSSNTEWSAVIEYFLTVLLHYRPELNKLSPLYVINESVYFAFSESKQDSVLFQRFLDFYSYFVKKLQSSPKLMEPLEQKSTVECLAGVAVAMFEISKENKDPKLYDNNIVRHILLMILSLIDWMVVNNDEFDQIKKELLITVTSVHLPSNAGPCIPIHRSIISRILQKKDAPLIALQSNENEPNLCQQIFKDYVSMKVNEVPVEMLELQKDWDTRDTYEYKPPKSM